MQYDYQADSTRKAKAALKFDSIMQALQNKSPAEINAWVDSNVNNLADVRRVLKVLLINLRVSQNE